MREVIEHRHAMGELGRMVVGHQKPAGADAHARRLHQRLRHQQVGRGMRLPRRRVMLPDPRLAEAELVRPAQLLQVPPVAVVQAPLRGMRRHREQSVVHSLLLDSREPGCRNSTPVRRRVTGVPVLARRRAAPGSLPCECDDASGDSAASQDPTLDARRVRSPDRARCVRAGGTPRASRRAPRRAGAARQPALRRHSSPDSHASRRARRHPADRFAAADRARRRLGAGARHQRRATGPTRVHGRASHPRRPDRRDRREPFASPILP